MPESAVLHVCSVDNGGASLHPCRRAAMALEDAGVPHTRNIFDKNRPAGLFTKGKRPKLKALSGQEKLPVLELPGGQTISGSKNIVNWAREQAPPR